MLSDNICQLILQCRQVPIQQTEWRYVMAKHSKTHPIVCAIVHLNIRAFLPGRARIEIGSCRRVWMRAGFSTQRRPVRERTLRQWDMFPVFPLVEVRFWNVVLPLHYARNGARMSGIIVEWPSIEMKYWQSNRSLFNKMIENLMELWYTAGLNRLDKGAAVIFDSITLALSMP